MMWKGANIEVIDLGTTSAPTSSSRRPGARRRLVGISALLTTTMVGMRDVVDAIRAAGPRDVRIMVGGAPVTPEYAAEIGADGYAPDAGSAVDVAKQALGLPARQRPLGPGGDQRESIPRARSLGCGSAAGPAEAPGGASV